MERRELLKSLFAFVPLGVSFAGISFMGLSFLSPSDRGNVERKIFATDLEDIPLNETKRFKDLQGKDLLLIRTGEKEVKALSTVCTHLGCTVYWQKEKSQFYCPCHQGIFDPDGNVLSGPPPKPLNTYKVEVDGNNVYIYSKDKEA